MKTLLLKNAKLKSLQADQVLFIGEKAGYIQLLKYNITADRYEDLKQLDKNKLYNIWKNDSNFIFKPLAAETWEELNRYEPETIQKLYKLLEE